MSTFAPDFDVDSYDEDTVRVVRTITDEINALRDALADPRRSEAARVEPNLRGSVEYWDEQVAERVLQVQQALIEIRKALTEGDPLPLALYKFDLDPEIFDDDSVRFLRQVAGELNDICERARCLKEWPDGISPAAEWDAQATKRVLDELFGFARQYRTSESFNALLKFVTGFRFYAPYNAMLVRAQMPGASYVAPAHRWSEQFGRTIKVDARPLVILQPMGPVMFVFDVSDTEARKDSPPLPPEVTNPFAVRAGHVGKELDWSVKNAKRDGVRIQPRKEGSQSGGSIRLASGGMVYFDAGNDRKGNPKLVEVPLRYDILFNQGGSKESQYASVVHELAHLYCGHMGTPNPTWKWWPDRRGLDLQTAEFEAESVAYLVCARIGIDNPSEKYLAGYFGKNAEVPNISVDLIMKAAGLIEQMGRGRMEPRKAGE